MKSYEEIAQNALLRIDQYEAEQKKRRKAVTRIATPVVSFGLAAVLCFGAWQSGVFQKPTASALPDTKLENESAANPVETPAAPSEPDVQMPTDNAMIPAQPQEDEPFIVEDSNAPEVNGVCIFLDSSLTQWGNKTVLSGLSSALEEAPADKVFDILAHPYIDYEFVYEGKTLAEYYSDMCDERNLPEILAQLLKEGDSLKYGTALYEGGAPNGVEMWAQSFYEERVAFYGSAILDKYLVDGTFLYDQVQSDLEAAKNAKEATIAYKAAFAAYYQHLIDTLQLSLPADVKGSNGIILHMTAEEFRNFSADHMEGWSFESESVPNDDVSYAAEVMSH